MFLIWIFGSLILPATAYEMQTDTYGYLELADGTTKFIGTDSGTLKLTTRSYYDTCKSRFANYVAYYANGTFQCLADAVTADIAVYLVWIFLILPIVVSLVTELTYSCLRSPDEDYFYRCAAAG
ncbi:unnamed protein product, partial [Mesorhabditis spiculigera]